MLGLGADPDDVVELDDLGEAGILGQEAIAGWIASACAISAAEMMLGTLRYESAAGGGPMQTASSASRTCIASASAVEWTATVLMPISWQARWMRSAISPRLAIRTFLMAIVSR
jgi:hypothetical protein